MFNPIAMKNFMKEDLLIKKMFEDLSKKNPNYSEEEVLEIVYNSEVFNDSIMEESYSKHFKKSQINNFNKKDVNLIIN